MRLDTARWKRVILPLALFVLGLLNAAPWKGFAERRRVEVNAENVRVATSLWRKGTFADPFINPTGYTAHVAPALPFFQSLLFRLAGDKSAGWLALRCLPALALSAQLALLPWAAWRLGFSTETGILASLFGLLVKPSLEERWESHLAGLAGLLLTTAGCAWLKRGRTMDCAIATGLVAGLASHLNPLVGSVYILWVLRVGHSEGYFTRNILPLWITPLLVVTPWTARNVIVMGGLVPMRDDLGIELYVSYNDCAPYSFRENMASCIQSFHPNSSAEEAAAVRALGEYRYNQSRLRKALLWIRSHPARSAKLIAARTWFFWFPSENGLAGYRGQRFRMLALHALTLGSFFGLYYSVRRRTISAPFLVLWVVAFPTVYYLVQFEYRYRYPLLWTTWLLGAEAIIDGGRAVRRAAAARERLKPVNGPAAPTARLW